MPSTIKLLFSSLAIKLILIFLPLSTFVYFYKILPIFKLILLHLHISKYQVILLKEKYFLNYQDLRFCPKTAALEYDMLYLEILEGMNPLWKHYSKNH